MKILHHFRFPLIISSVALALVYLFLGYAAFFTAFILSILEVTLSFDNAVVNAKVLQRMSDVWRKRFLTWGILIAVVGTRFLLPIVIVSLTTFAPPLDILRLAIEDAHAYGELLAASDVAIKAFGGMFLLMVALKYFVDDGKTIHWVATIEHRLARLGSIESAEILLGLIALIVTACLVTPENVATVLMAGLVGVIVFLIMEGTINALALVSKHAALSGMSMFVYLNILDAAFSLDGVVGAFALTNNLVIIAVGLGIGAYLVRSMTLYFVRRETLNTIRYIEHGAHWAIFGLAATMLVGLLVHIPETVSGFIGLFFVASAYVSSIRHIARTSA